jgi:hypothetical protein
VGRARRVGFGVLLHEPAPFLYPALVRVDRQRGLVAGRVAGPLGGRRDPDQREDEEYDDRQDQRSTHAVGIPDAGGCERPDR